MPVRDTLPWTRDRTENINVVFGHLHCLNTAVGVLYGRFETQTILL